MGGQNPAVVAWKHELQQDLGSIQKVGDFAVQRTYSQFVNPGLEIDGSTIPLPLDPLLADRIKDVAKPASFGVIGRDLVESSSNIVWELDHGQFRIANPSWPAFFETFKEDMAHGLGLDPSEIDFKSAKLVLYEKGSFVSRYQFTQETPGLIGRLTICLPSEHMGGSICVEHAGRHHALATAPTSAFNLSALAWYAGVSQEVTEITSGQRLELTYCMMESSAANSATFLINQHARLKERIDSWPKALSKLVYLLDHHYSPETLCSTNLKGHDLAIVDILKSMCSKVGIYLFLGNVAKEYHQETGHFMNDSDLGLNINPLCNKDGVEISSLVRMSGCHLIPADPYSNGSADEVEEGLEEKKPTRLTYKHSAVVLIHRNKLHKLLVPPTTNTEVIMALVAEDLKRNPGDASFRADMLRITDKIVYLMEPCLKIVESAWYLKDMPLYRRAIRHCAARDDILKELPLLLATRVSESSAPQVETWGEGLIDLLGCCPDTLRTLTVLSDFEQALSNKHLQDSFQVWATSLKRDKLTSSEYLVKADLRLSKSWQPPFGMTKPGLRNRRCPNRTLIFEVIKTLVAKDVDHTLPGAEEAAKKILTKQLRRLYLGEVSLFSVNDQRAIKKMHKFIDTVRVCLTFGFMEESLKLIKRIKPDMEQRRHFPRQSSVFGGIETGVDTPYEPILAHNFVHMLGNLFEAHDEPLVEEVFRDLFEYLLRHYVNPALVLYPLKGRRKALKDLREERFKRILGDHLFQELILLETPSTDHEHSSQTVAGVKRKAEEEFPPPPRDGERWWVS